MHCVAEVVSLHYKWWYIFNTTTFTNTSFIHKIIYTYKCLCDLTMVCELPLRRKDDWPQETMARSCLYISFSSSRTDCTKMTEPGKVNQNDNCFSRNASFCSDIHLLCSAVMPAGVQVARRGAVCWTLHCFNGKRLLALAGAGAVCNATTKNAETVLHIYFNYNVLNNDGEHLS